MKLISWRVKGMNDQSLVYSRRIVEFGIAGLGFWGLVLGIGFWLILKWCVLRSQKCTLRYMLFTSHVIWVGDALIKHDDSTAPISTDERRAVF
jgi:hypothetical protein